MSIDPNFRQRMLCDAFDRRAMEMERNLEENNTLIMMDRFCEDRRADQLLLLPETPTICEPPRFQPIVERFDDLDIPQLRKPYIDPFDCPDCVDNQRVILPPSDYWEE